LEKDLEYWGVDLPCMVARTIISICDILCIVLQAFGTGMIDMYPVVSISSKYIIPNYSPFSRAFLDSLGLTSTEQRILRSIFRGKSDGILVLQR
jgi:hypothetical protein